MFDHAAISQGPKHDSEGIPLPKTNYSRYGIFFTPTPNSALAAFSRSWFGHTGDGSTLHAFSGMGLSTFGSAKTPASPGRYHGLHVPFKSPFPLRKGMGPDALRSRLKTFAKRRQPVATGPLTLTREGTRLVLRPKNESPTLVWLAAQCVSGFDGFAGTLERPETDETDDSPLSDYQRLLLGSFGDAHVMSEFRFALRLTGPLETGQIERVSEALWPVLEGICEEGITIDALSLLGDPGGRAPLRLLKRYRLEA